MLPPFQVFFDEQRAVVHRFLVARVGAGEAEDCFQETFLAALRAYPRLPPDAHLRAWVLKVAERKAIDAHRARQRRPRPQEEVPDNAGPGWPAGPPGLWAEVAALPAKQRTALTLRYGADLAYAEIGQAIGCSEDAARQSVRAGLAKLRARWDT